MEIGSFNGRAVYHCENLTYHLGKHPAEGQLRAVIDGASVSVMGLEVEDSKLLNIMAEFLTEKISESLNTPCTYGEEEESEEEEEEVTVPEMAEEVATAVGRKLSGLPKFDTEKILNKIKQDPTVMDIEKKFEKVWNDIEDTYESVKELKPTCEEYERASQDQVKARKNFYKLVEIISLNADANADVFYWNDVV